MRGPQTALKLHALDREGLAVISAHTQDTCMRREDMTWLRGQNRFVLAGMRYDWASMKHGVDERIGSVLRFDRVLRVSHVGLAGCGSDGVVNLLGLTFEKTDAPSGMVFLAFADGSIVRLEVECLEAELRDVGPRQRASECPGHAVTRAEANGSRRRSDGCFS